MTDNTTPVVISTATVQTALIPAVGMSDDLQASIQKLVQDLLTVCNTASNAGLPVGIVDSAIGLVKFTVKATLWTMIDAGMNNDGTAVAQTADELADALAAQASSLQAALKSVQDAQAEHAATRVPPATPPAPPTSQNG